MWAALRLSGMAAFVLAGLGCAGSAPSEMATEMGTRSSIRTVLLTRHAEKADLSADPMLSVEGAQRAAALSELEAVRGVRSIFTTEYRRTIETAMPVARRLGILSRPVQATGSRIGLEQLARDILDAAVVGDVLVVGHSNTVPRVIEALGGPGDIVLREEDFGDLFILRIADDGTVEMERLRYCDE